MLEVGVVMIVPLCIKHPLSVLSFLVPGMGMRVGHPSRSRHLLCTSPNKCSHPQCIRSPDDLHLSTCAQNFGKFTLNDDTGAWLSVIHDIVSGARMSDHVLRTDSAALLPTVSDTRARMNQYVAKTDVVAFVANCTWNHVNCHPPNSCMTQHTLRWSISRKCNMAWMYTEGNGLTLSRAGTFHRLVAQSCICDIDQSAFVRDDEIEHNLTTVQGIEGLVSFFVHGRRIQILRKPFVHYW